MISGIDQGVQLRALNQPSQDWPPFAKCGLNRIKTGLRCSRVLSPVTIARKSDSCRPSDDFIVNLGNIRDLADEQQRIATLMAQHDNQHFVPKFYFRQFNGGTECIQVFCPTKNRLIRDAPIKGQCAQHRFYGNDEIENVLCGLESSHRCALRYLIDAAWATTPLPQQTGEQHALMLQAVLFQKSRTVKEAQKRAARTSAFTTKLFSEYLKRSEKNERKDEMLKLFDSGAAKITTPLSHLLLESIADSLLNGMLLSDLDFCILRNKTHFPFIFCDSPVVFHNSYYQNVKSRGVVGLTTPGLQIFYPLDSKTMLMLFDSNVYSGLVHETDFIDLRSGDEVSQMNVLQLHSHNNTIYCGHHLDLGYAQQLWRAHRHSIHGPDVGFEVRKNWLIDGEPVPTMYQHIERQFDVRLDLSFINCRPIPERAFEFRRRDPSLWEKFIRFRDRLDGKAVGPKVSKRNDRRRRG